jgi:hypothetical protein
MRATVSVLGANPEVTNQRVCAQNNIAIQQRTVLELLSISTDETVGTPFAVETPPLENILQAQQLM